MPLKLEDKLTEAQAGLDQAMAAYGEVEKQIRTEREAAHDNEVAAEKVLGRAERALSEARKEARSRLGLTPAKARRAVLAWAGLKPGEDAQAFIRGSEEVLERAIASIIDNVVERDLSVMQARHSEGAARRARVKLSERLHEIEKPLEEAHKKLYPFQRTVKELTDKIRERNEKKRSAATRPVATKEDEARYVEARKRIAAAGERGYQAAKISPAFVWPPKPDGTDERG